MRTVLLGLLVAIATVLVAPAGSVSSFAGAPLVVGHQYPSSLYTAAQTRAPYLLSEYGYGPARWGMSLDAVSQSFAGALRPGPIGPVCSRITGLGASSPTFVFPDGGGHLGFVEGGGAVTTTRGIHVGDSVKKVRRHYHDLRAIPPQFGFSWLVHRSSRHALIFQIRNHRVGWLEAQEHYSRPNLKTERCA